MAVRKQTKGGRGFKKREGETPPEPHHLSSISGNKSLNGYPLTVHGIRV